MYIETKRMIIRDFVVEDAGDLQEIFGDEETMKNCEPAYDLAKTVEFLEKFCIGRKGAVAAVEKASGKVIGYILFNELEERVYEMGWIFHRSFWGNGYAYESCRAVMDHAFTDLHAHKIFAEAIDGVKSVGLMKKLGMQPEGIQRSQTKDNDGKLAGSVFLRDSGGRLWEDDVSMTNEKVYAMSVARVYPLLVNKAVRKGHTEEEVVEIIRWLTGYDTEGLQTALAAEVSYETFFANAPEMNPNRKKITGVVCGIRVENIEEPLMQEIRYLDKLIDELAKGKSMEKILRQ